MNTKGDWTLRIIAFVMLAGVVMLMLACVFMAASGVPAVPAG